CGGLERFTQGYKEYGLLVQPDNSVLCHEWAPGADQLALIGDFNGWNRESHKYKREEHGKWRLVIPPNSDGSCAIPHGSIVKIAVTKNGKTMDKLSPWAAYVTRPKDTVVYHQN
ncbi:isoamylase protein, partial [Teladorsagia circumcincta]